MGAVQLLAKYRDCLEDESVWLLEKNIKESASHFLSDSRDFVGVNDNFPSMATFTKSEFKSVYAIGGNYRCQEAKEEFPDFYDNVILSASFVNGMQGAIDGAQGVAYGYDARVEILGTKGCIFLGQVHDGSIITCSKDSGMVRPIMNSWRHLFRDAYLEEDISFINTILNDEEPKVSGLDGKMAVKVVRAGNLSIKEKRIVQL